MSRTATLRTSRIVSGIVPLFVGAIIVVMGCDPARAARVDLPNSWEVTSEHWPEFNAVLNRSRIHASNINGSLHASFRGDVTDFNRVLEALGKSKAKRRIVVIRPGGGEGELEDKAAAEWKLSLPGDLEMAYRGDSASPSLGLYLGGDGFDPAKIKWPAGFEPKELKDLYDPFKALKEGKWGSGVHPYSLVGDMIIDEDAVLPYLLKPLVDRKSAWQSRTGACYSLGRLGAKARVAREVLRIVAEQDEVGQVRRAAKEALPRIDDPTRNRAHNKAKQIIAEYMRGRRQTRRVGPNPTTQPALSGRTGGGGGRISMAQRVAGTEVIVRARFDGLTNEGANRWRVLRVLKGMLEQDLVVEREGFRAWGGWRLPDLPSFAEIAAMAKRAEANEGTDPELEAYLHRRNLVIDGEPQESILFLGSLEVAGDRVYCNPAGRSVGPAVDQDFVDAEEQRIVELVASGAHLTAPEPSPNG